MMLLGTEYRSHDVLPVPGWRRHRTVSRRMEDDMRNDARKPHWLKTTAPQCVGRTLDVIGHRNGDLGSRRAKPRRMAAAAVLPMSLAGLLLARPASALSPVTIEAVGTANIALNLPDCVAMVTGPSAVSAKDVLAGIVANGEPPCPNPRDTEPKCIGLRENFGENPQVNGLPISALSFQQGGIGGRTVLFQRFSQGIVDVSDFAPGQVPFPPLTAAESRTLILLHELGHSTDVVPREVSPAAQTIARAYNSAVVRLCIRPDNPGFPTAKQFWLGPAAACGRPTHSTPACSAILGTACPQSGVFSCTGSTCDADDQHVFYQGYLLRCL
jgi:hypothetical protein